MSAAALLTLEAHTRDEVRACITYPDHDVFVTFQACEHLHWTCSVHGATYAPTCPHTRATEYAVRAQTLLNPTEGETP